ncbi:MAG TPA: ABC transporter permease subunit [Candidatus Thermoplasmatota archaeon]|nr:ABC transporter permease subunit [Candidatus Thermoplasmatota archaeon]
MSVGSPLSTLLKSNFRAWVSAKGFWLVAAAALLPLVLTGAWVGAHRADIAITDLRIEGGNLTEGQSAHVVGVVKNVGSERVGAFNLSLAVGEVEAGRLFPAADQTLAVEGLAPGETKEVALDWNATSGVVYALVTADPEDEIGEKDEFNNQKAEPLAIAHTVPTTPPSAPLGLAGDANSTNEVDLVVDGITRSATEIHPQDNVTFTVTVRNNGAAVSGAQLVTRLVRAVGARPVTLVTQNQTVDLGAGETKTLDVTWTALDGAFWQEGYVLPPPDTKDVAADNNYRSEPVVVNTLITPDMRPPEPEERLTIKQFYLDVLSLLHLRLLLPLIALFYAAGVIADEKERGSLAYLLTRPVPRWLIPITKFIASFLVAAVATVIGVLLTYLFLFGTTVEGGDIGFLTTPLLATLLTLFAYGGLFILLGTITEKPYLWGLGIVLGWENAAPLLVPWVGNFTLSRHIGNALAGWKLDEGVQWLPEGGEAMRAFWILLAIGVGALVLAAAQMRRREFQVG